MISNKRELKQYLKQDKMALGIERKRPKIFGDEIWKFQIIYRKYEYLRNNAKKIYNFPILLYYKYIFEKKSIKLGFSIPINVFGPGLSIAHYGTIVINGNAKIGKNCRIQENVTIGSTNGSNNAPIIGDNVFIGSGAKIIGNIEIAKDIAIGAGSVVVKSFNQSGITIAGVPAKKISDNNSYKNLNKRILEEE